MQQQPSFYPIRIISRAAAKKRSRRLLGLASGAALSIIASLSVLFNVMEGHWGAHDPSVTQVASKDSGIKVTAFALPSKTTKPVKPQINQTNINRGIYPLTVSVTVENGDTLLDLLTTVGVSYDEAHHVVTSIAKVQNPKKLDIGQSISVVLDQESEGSATPLVTNLRLPLGPTTVLDITRKELDADAEFELKKIDISMERKLAHAGGRINSSLYETGVETGLPLGVLNDVINAYSYDVDFQREIQPGDTIDVLYEKLQTKDGTAIGNGDVIYAELTLGGRDLKIYRYTDKSGIADYYNEKGESIRKSLLRTPINGAHISSGFGMRNHPILGYSIMHRGVDFAAPTGTPIYAAGDGTIKFVGRKGGYGNYIRIHHNNQYESAYAHISRFVSGLNSGGHVRQGQIIAYVGSSGLATGPHLHYEILLRNQQVNPASVKFRTGNVLSGPELTTFRKTMEKIEAQLATAPRSTRLAMSDSPRRF